MTDFTVMHDTVLKVIWERFADLEAKIDRLQSILEPKCKHEFTCQSMTAQCYHCGIKRADIPQICVHEWEYPEPRSLPTCKHCGEQTL